MGEKKGKGDWVRRVLCVETGIVYRSIQECSRKMGIPYKTIQNSLTRRNRVYGRYYFALIDDDESLRTAGRDSYIECEVMAKKLNLWGESAAVSRRILEKVPLFTIADLERAWEAGAENERAKHGDGETTTTL